MHASHVQRTIVDGDVVVVADRRRRIRRVRSIVHGGGHVVDGDFIDAASSAAHKSPQER